MKNQKDYWNKVAWYKTFTHPLNTKILSEHISKHSKILDFGCGYGRVVELFKNNGYENIVGIDTSKELIKRGLIQSPTFDLKVIDGSDLPFDDNTFDLVSIFAVLTCIPKDQDQIAVIEEIKRVLKPSGVIYVSDYYLQSNRKMIGLYKNFTDKYNNYGVFEIDEGAIFRHHQEDWFYKLFDGLNIENHEIIDVTTLQGGNAQGVQFVAVQN